MQGVLRSLSQRLPTPCVEQLLPLASSIGNNVLSMQQAAGSTSSSKSAAGEPCKRILYKGHNPISPSQRVGLTFISAFSAFADPERADMVAALGETTGHRALKQMHHRMLQDPDGIELLRERPQLDEHSVDLEALGQLPSGTFGKAYADFMAHNQFTPDSRLPVRFVDDADLAYVMARYRQVHDLWHVLSGLPPSLEGEIALKWFEMVQTGLPVAAISALVGAARVPREGRAALRQKLVPWAIRAGRRSVPLMNVWYERYWDMYLSNFREKLKFEPAPQ